MNSNLTMESGKEKKKKIIHRTSYIGHRRSLAIKFRGIWKKPEFLNFSSNEHMHIESLSGPFETCEMSHRMFGQHEPSYMHLLKMPVRVKLPKFIFAVKFINFGTNTWCQILNKNVMEPFIAAGDICINGNDRHVVDSFFFFNYTKYAIRICQESGQMVLQCNNAVQQFTILHSYFTSNYNIAQVLGTGCQDRTKS